jgi:valyl-tRNA synthetase
MLLFGLYIGRHNGHPMKKSVPFTHVVLHGMVNDPLGKKMSKSKGNVVNPLEVADQYGADSLRMALVYGTGLGHDQSMSYAKLDAMRKFANKLWNIARFIDMKRLDLGLLPENTQNGMPSKANIHKADTQWMQKVEQLGTEVTKYLNSYQFNLAAERLYEFIWHDFADNYIEEVKNRMDRQAYDSLLNLYLYQLKLLHPFMPFITEEIFHKLSGTNKSIMIELWPSINTE